MQLVPVQEAIYCTQENHRIFIVLRNSLENVGFFWRSFYELLFSENCTKTIQVVLNAVCSKQPIRSDLQWPKKSPRFSRHQGKICISIFLRESIKWFPFQCGSSSSIRNSTGVRVDQFFLWLAVCCKIQEHNIFIQGKLFFFNTNIHSTLTQTILFLKQIFIQLQLKLFSFNQKISIELLYLKFPEIPNVYSTKTTRPLQNLVNVWHTNPASIDVSSVFISACSWAGVNSRYKEMFSRLPHSVGNSR